MNKVLGFIVLLTGAFISDSINLYIDISETYDNIPAGENFWFTTFVDSELNGYGILTYSIHSAEGKLLAERAEEIDLTIPSYLESMQIPDNASGEHIITAILEFEGESIITSQTFNVIDKYNTDHLIIKDSLFDIILDVPENYRAIDPGQQLLVSTKLINVGSSGRIDVFLEYKIVDSQEKMILSKRETVAVETQANFIRTFDIPDSTKPGTYKIVARMVYANGKYADAEYSFRVAGRNVAWLPIIIGVTIMVGILLSLFIRHIGPHAERSKIRSRVKDIVDHRIRHK